MKRYSIFALAVMALCAGSAQAQAGSCGASDFDCKASQAIFEVVTKYSAKSGILEFAIGTVCESQVLLDRGKQKFSESIPGVIAQTRTAVDQVIGSATANQADRIRASIPMAVRLARGSQASGVVAGLRSEFSIHPRAKSEYCANIVKALKG